MQFVAGADPVLHYLNRPEELEVPLGKAGFGDIFWSNDYLPGLHTTVLARFEDGTAALLRENLGKGSTYLVGVSYHDVILRNQVGRDFSAEGHYVNDFEPGADGWLLLLRAWYESAEPDAVRLATIPQGKRSVLLLSHDVDWENSFDPALDFALMEKRHQVLSTFFIQTKYLSDFNSRAFFFGRNLRDIKQLHAEGFSIGSHSVIHSRAFNRFELATDSKASPAIDRVAPDSKLHRAPRSSGKSA